MKLLILFGAPAVGKSTVGKHVEVLTDFKLFHNHMVTDGIMHIFGVGTPPEDRLSKLVRTQIIEEAASISSLPTSGILAKTRARQILICTKASTSLMAARFYS